MSDCPWSTLGTADRVVGVRIADSHPLDLYWARAQDGSPGLVLRGIKEAWLPKELPKVRGLVLTSELDGQVLGVQMFLRDRADHDVFHALCRDVIEYSSGAWLSEESTKRFFRRLGHWHLLMDRAVSGAMEAAEIRGLIGELVILDRLMRTLGTSAAVAAWVAPSDHPQDFALNKGLLEVKTRTSGSRERVQVSSLEQLDSKQHPLFLAVVELMPSDGADSMSLNEMCAHVLDLARAQDLSVEDRLESALLQRGYLKQAEYDTQRYEIAGVSAYSVRDDFPRIVRSHVDLRIVKAGYTLDLSLLNNFVVPVEMIIG